MEYCEVGRRAELQHRGRGSDVTKYEIQQRESHLFGNDDIFEAVVATARAPKSSHLPVVVDYHLVSRHDDHAHPRRRRLARNKYGREDPLRMMNPTAKGRTRLDLIASGDWFGGPCGRDRTGHRRDAIGADPACGSGRQHGGYDRTGACEDPEYPARGTIDARHRFIDFHASNRAGL